MSISALGSGLAGMRNAQRALDVSAGNIASSRELSTQPDSTAVSSTSADGSFTSTLASLSGGSADLASSIVDQIQSKASFQASAKVVQTASDVLGTLINTIA